MRDSLEMEAVQECSFWPGTESMTGSVTVRQHEQCRDLENEAGKLISDIIPFINYDRIASTVTCQNVSCENVYPTATKAVNQLGGWRHF